ncbi:hypothetical protein [Burkholderia singularis]|uniref:Transmembrane protein n=2 Tax=Burkholderiaceae TaxID=119060 RepID=A0A238H126_9BURK|nr:hypothetical protein [Burkholderia singularis]SMF98892.1 hypothetical protein BSIN_2735 [Burkholderia singularis]
MNEARMQAQRDAHVGTLPGGKRMMAFSVVSAMSLIVTVVMVSLIVGMAFGLPKIISAAHADTAIKDGYSTDAEVVEISQTGVTLNQVPLMRIVLRVDDRGGQREVTIRQYVDLGNMPRAGERVRVVVDKSDPKRVTYMGLAPRKP